MLLLGIRLFLAIKLVQSANILGICTIPSISHQVVYHPIWRELSLRGHKVTVLTPDPLNDPKLVNLTEIDLHHAYGLWTRTDVPDLIAKDANKFLLVPPLYNNLFHALTEYYLNDTNVKRLFEDRSQTFDVILLEAYYPTWNALSRKYNAPIVGIASTILLLAQYDSVGNPAHPVLYPDILLEYHGSLTLRQRIKSTLYTIWVRLYYHYVVLPRAHRLAAKYFGNDIPDVEHINGNISLWLINQNLILHPIRPNVPAIMQMGLMHLLPNKTLPKDLQDVLDGATNGAVYFSLGSNMKSVAMQERLRNIILDALADLPFTVLWKWEDDDLPRKPKNVLLRKWFPQQDLLAHPNIKVFVTQGGLQSIEEAISRGVPMVGMPFMAEQPMNIQKITELGIAIGVDFETVTSAELKAAIMEAAENTKYRDRIREIRGIMNDQPMTGLEKAIWWTEYVIRHKGARHLRSPALDTPWYIYYLLDVIAVILGSIYFSYFILKNILRYLYVEYLQKKVKIH